jgi:enamine deaminase RidA (YjgF/YER057c/UK114 family)
MRLPFEFAALRGDRLLFSGHLPQTADGSVVQTLGKVGAEVTVEQGYEAAKLTMLAILGSIEREIGDLDRIVSWNRIFGMVNSAPGFTQQPAVINGASDLLIAVFGAEKGAHTRSAVGVAELPLNIPVEIEGEATIR